MPKHLGLITLLTFTLAACGAAATSGGPPGPTPTPSGDPRRPKPLNVQITPDSARTVEGVLTPAGGTLTATAADGTTFTLAAPENAVLSTLTVKMTPVEQLSGLNGAKGYLAAVHLEPEGTEFLEPLSLRITAPHALNAGALRGFNSHGLGSEFYYQGRNVEGRTVTLQLMHFSNPGVAQLDDSDLIVPIPVNPRDRFENDLALDLTHESQIIGQFYAQIQPELNEATISNARLQIAIEDFLTWRGEIDRLGLNSEFKDKIYAGWTRIAQGIEAAVARAHAECAVNNDLTRLRDILTWVSWVKRNPRLSPYFSGKLAQFEQQARDCASFELEVDSTVSATLGDQEKDSHTIHLLIPLQPGVGDRDLLTSASGHAPIESRQFSSQLSCTVTPDPPVPLADAEAQLELMWQGDKAAAVAVNLDPGLIDVMGTVTCPPPDGQTVHGVHLATWVTWFSLAHDTDHTAECSTLGCIRIEEWQPGTGEVLATRTYQRTLTPVSAPAAVIQENTTLTLRHTPK